MKAIADTRAKLLALLDQVATEAREKAPEKMGPLCAKLADAAGRLATASGETPQWQPLKRGAPIFRGGSLEAHADLLSADLAATTGASARKLQKEARRLLRDEVNNAEVWINDLYQVSKRLLDAPDMPDGKIWHLSIKRRDRMPLHDWPDLQRIKNELVGHEYEALELYPAESRRVDASNQYHLWVLTVPVTEARIPVGWNNRCVSRKDGQRPDGSVQRYKRYD
jgi:hypothetical protein